MIKHQGGAGEDREGRVGGIWCSLVASGLTTGRGQVGSRPGEADEYEVLRDSVVTKYQGVLVSGHVGPRSEVVRWAHGLV